MKKINWNKAWQDMNNQYPTNNTSEFWDAFAPKFRKKRSDGKPDPYIIQFYELAEIKHGETLFDMGCGAGTLAVPFAKKGHEVYAADFSQGMLDQLMIEAESEGVDGRIHPINLDWNEDWSLRDLPICDVAFSSRSMIFDDLTSSLKKLESVARRRCCMGVWDGPAPGYDRHVGKAIGYERPGYGTYFFVLNELIDRDMFPELLYIKSPFRLRKYESYEQGRESLREGFIYGLSGQQEKMFDDYCREHMIHHVVEDGGDISARGDAQGKNDYWQLDHDDMSTMAFIRWDKKTVYDR